MSNRERKSGAAAATRHHVTGLEGMAVLNNTRETKKSTHIEAEKRIEVVALEIREPGRNKRSAETIDQILVAAEQIILESGVDRVAIQDVCHVAGISRGTFYRYFSSQDALLDAFSKHKRARFHLAMHAATAPYLVPADRFNALISYLDNYLKHSKARRLLEIAPEFAFKFFNRIFHDSVERFQEVLDIVFDSWDAQLGVQIDRGLVCEMLIRYVLSELLVPRKGDRRQLLSQIGQMTRVISAGGDHLPKSLAQVQPADGRKVRPVRARSQLAHGQKTESGQSAASDTASEPGRNRRSRKTINQILTATEQVILETGVGRVSIQSVCEVAGIARGTFYRYFSSQDELLEAFTQHKREVFHQALLATTEPYSDPDERFAALVEHLDGFLKGTKARRLLMVAPKYAFGFFQYAFLDSLDRFQSTLDIVFDAWDARLSVTLDRELICEMLIRYVLSELLVLGEGDRKQFPQRIGKLIGGIKARRHMADTGPLPTATTAAGVSPRALELATQPPLEAGRSRRSDVIVEEIISAAEEVILASGVERIPISVVCELTGISRGTFYRYFSSQDDLLNAFTERQHLQFHQTLLDAVAPHEDVEGRFNAVIGHLETFLASGNSRRILAVAPDYALGFFQRMFGEAVERYKAVLKIVFDAWDDQDGKPLDRDLACELLVRYILGQLLVPTPKSGWLLPVQLGAMMRAASAARGK